MKALSMRILAGVIALGALLYILACSPATQNNNSSQNQNLSGNQASAAAKELEPCDSSVGDPNHGEGLKGKIEKKIKDKPFSSLKKLLKDSNNLDGTFTVEVKKGEGANVEYFVAYIRGKVSGDNNLKDLSDVMNDFQDEKNCLRLVYLL